MRCSLLFFVSLIVSSYAAPVPYSGAGSIGIVLGGLSHGKPSTNSDIYGVPRAESDDAPDATEIPPVPEKKPRGNSRLSNSKIRSRTLAGDLKAAESKPIPRAESNGVGQPSDSHSTSYGLPHTPIDKITGHIGTIISSRDSEVKRDVNDELLGDGPDGYHVSQGRDTIPAGSSVTHFGSPDGGIGSFLGGNAGVPRSSPEAPDVDLTPRESTTETHPPRHIDDSAVVSPVTPIAIHKRDGDGPSVA